MLPSEPARQAVYKCKYGQYMVMVALESVMDLEIDNYATQKDYDWEQMLQV